MDDDLNYYISNMYFKSDIYTLMHLYKHRMYQLRNIYSHTSNEILLLLDYGSMSRSSVVILEVKQL